MTSRSYQIYSSLHVRTPTPPSLTQRPALRIWPRVFPTGRVEEGRAAAAAQTGPGKGAAAVSLEPRPVSWPDAWTIKLPSARQTFSNPKLGAAYVCNVEEPSEADRAAEFGRTPRAGRGRCSLTN